MLWSDEIPAEAFFADPLVADPALSPNGRFVAMLQQVEKQWLLVTVDLQDRKVEPVAKFDTINGIDYWWKGNDRFLLRTPRGYFALNRDGTGKLDLPEMAYASLRHMLPDDFDHVLISSPLGAKLVTRRLDLNTGKTEVVDRTPGEISTWIVGRNGLARAGFTYEAGRHRWRMIWRAKAGAPWQERLTEGEFVALVPSLEDTDPRYLISALYSKTGTTSVVRFDTETGEIAPVFQHPEVDILTLVQWPPHQKLGAVGYATDRLHYEFLDAEMEKFFTTLDRSVPGTDSQIIGTCADGSKRLLTTEGATVPPVYLLYDAAKGRVEQLGVTNPRLHPTLMAARRSFSYRTRDGWNVTGQLTLPKEPTEKKPPLVVWVGYDADAFARSPWGFDGLAQFFASRGFAFARLNVRGTIGFGHQHEATGSLKIDTVVLADFEDGVGFLAAENLIDPARVAIGGASFGGLIALHTLAHSSHFQAAINLNCPVSLDRDDLLALAPSHSTWAESLNAAGSAKLSLEYLKQITPLAYTDRLQKPTIHFYSTHGTQLSGQGIELRRSFEKQKIPFKLIRGEHNTFLPDTPEESGRVYSEIVDFLRQSLR